VLSGKGQEKNMKNSAKAAEAGRNGADGGIRLTRQRKAILQTLKSVVTHPTADELYEMIRKQLPKVSLGTVYRNLEILCQNGLVQKLELAGMQRRYDGDVSEHYHVRCVNCGRIADVKIPSMHMEQFFKYVPQDFKVVGFRLKFLAVCSKCVEKGMDEKVALQYDKKIPL
jgi:Fur family ferric uptake transcriptional regulator